jgi:dihydropyrimidinase
VLSDGSVVDADILVDGGRIVGLVDPRTPIAARQIIDGKGLHALPGIIDAHVHIGFYDELDENRSETASAAVGGVTTTLRYFRALRPYEEIFPAELARAARLSHVDYAYHLGLLIDEHLDHVERYVAEWGVRSFKMYSCYKGEERAEFGLRGQDDGFMFDVFRRLAKIPGTLALVHAENEDIILRETKRLRAMSTDGRVDLAVWDEARPAIAEFEAVQRVTTLAAEAECPLYLPHVSAKSALEYAIERKRGGQELYIETLSAYLGLDHDAPAGFLATVNPPIRARGNAESHWRALHDGNIDAVASDHCPTPAARKIPGKILDSPSGIPGLATLLPVLLSEGVNKSRIALGDIARIQSRVATIFGLPMKGALAPGRDADIVLVDLNLERLVRGSELLSRADYSPFEGLTLRGWPVLTMLRGSVIARDGVLVGEPGTGRYLRG